MQTRCLYRRVGLKGRQKKAPGPWLTWITDFSDDLPNSLLHSFWIGIIIKSFKLPHDKEENEEAHKVKHFIFISIFLLLFSVHKQ